MIGKKLAAYPWGQDCYRLEGWTSSDSILQSGEPAPPERFTQRKRAVKDAVDGDRPWVVYEVVKM